MDTITLGILVSLAAGSATGIGALPIFFKKSFSDSTLDILLGFAAGVMLAASSFSLFGPALGMESGGIWIVSIGFASGVLLIHLVDRWAPHKHFIKGPEGRESPRLAATWLFVIAISIHNFPEGLAVGVCFGTGEVATWLVVAVAIGLQNIPEGTAVAVGLMREGYNKRDSFLVSLATGLVEPIGAAIGVIAVTLAAGMLGFGMAFAAGAMIFVVSDEMIPESHRPGHERQATFGVVIGFLVMMFLDNLIVV